MINLLNQIIEEVGQEGIIQSKIQLVYKNNESQDLDQDQLNFKKLHRKIKYLTSP
jgi:hypothetical protein